MSFVQHTSEMMTQKMEALCLECMDYFISRMIISDKSLDEGTSDLICQKVLDFQEILSEEFLKHFNEYKQFVENHNKKKITYKARTIRALDLEICDNNHVILFEDNEVDKYRKDGVERTVENICGHFDRHIANRHVPVTFGITTVFKRKCSVKSMKKIWDQEFDIIKNMNEQIIIYDCDLHGKVKHNFARDLSEKARLEIQKYLDNLEDLSAMSSVIKEKDV